MTPVELVDELVKFLEEVAKRYELEVKGNDKTKAPNIHAGYLPDKKNGNDNSEFPYVIVRFLNEEDSDSDIVNIRLIIGTYSEDEVGGWRDPLNIATRIKISLRKKGFIKAFSVGDKIKIDLFEDQPFPQWFAVMDIPFTIPQVQPEWSELSE